MGPRVRVRPLVAEVDGPGAPGKDTEGRGGGAFEHVNLRVKSSFPALYT